MTMISIIYVSYLNQLLKLLNIKFVFKIFIDNNILFILYFFLFLARPVMRKFWERGQPNNQTSGPFCVVNNIYGYYQVHSCDDGLYFICENIAM